MTVYTRQSATCWAMLFTSNTSTHNESEVVGFHDEKPHAYFLGVGVYGKTGKDLRAFVEARDAFLAQLNDVLKLDYLLEGLTGALNWPSVYLKSATEDCAPRCPSSANHTRRRLRQDPGANEKSARVIRHGRKGGKNAV